MTPESEGRLLAELAEVLATNRANSTRFSEHTERLRRLEQGFDDYKRDASTHRSEIRQEIESLRNDIRRAQSTPPAAIQSLVDARIREILRPIEERLEERLELNKAEIKHDLKTLSGHVVDLTVAMREHVTEYRTGCALRHQSINDRINGHDSALAKLSAADVEREKEIESERMSMIAEYKDSRKHWVRYVAAVAISAVVGYVTSKGCVVLHKSDRMPASASTSRLASH